MPELPEVETIRRDLTKLIVGKKILDIETDSAKQVKPSLVKVKKAIVGTKIKRIERRAKLLQIFQCPDKTFLLYHDHSQIGTTLFRGGNNQGDSPYLFSDNVVPAVSLVSIVGD